MATELYYDIAGKIDQHNRDRQATLGMEKKIKTHDWAKRVNLTILSMCLVDAWKAWSLISVDDEGQCIETQKKFYAHLAAELIDNNYDGVSTRRRARADELEEPRQLLLHPRTGELRRGIDLHLTPTKRRRVIRGNRTNYTFQGRCYLCKQKTMLVCSGCEDDETIAHDVYICDPVRGRMCWGEHTRDVHNI
jgi:hypothetical protein